MSVCIFSPCQQLDFRYFKLRLKNIHYFLYNSNKQRPKIVHMVSHVFAFCLKVLTSIKVNFRTAGIFLGYLVSASKIHFQAIIHVVQNRQGGKQESRWEKTNKGNYHSVSLGPGSASGGKGEKYWRGQNKKKIGEQSEPGGSLLRGEGWRSLFPSPGNRSARFALRYFSYLTPFLAFSPPPCGFWSHPTIQSKDVRLCFPAYRIVPRECAKDLFSFII